MKKVLFAVLPLRTGTSTDASFNSILDVVLCAGAMGYGRIAVPNLRTDVARHRVQQKFMELTSHPDDTLLMLDEDHIFQNTILEQLVQDDKPVVGALSFRRGEPYYPCMFKKDTNGLLQPIRKYERGLVQVDALGFPAVAIKRSVFETLEKEGFTLYPNFCYEYPGFSFPSEDLFFSELCYRAGIPMYVDTRIVCPHLIIGTVDESSWEQYKNEHTASGGRVSVIIAGQTDHLQKCVETLIQTAPECEIIVLAKIGLAANLPQQAKKVLITQNKTPEQVWGLGAKIAKGDVLMTIKDDAEFEPGWLEASLSALSTLPNEGGLVETPGGYLLISKGLYDAKRSAEDTIVIAKKSGRYVFAAAATVRKVIG